MSKSLLLIPGMMCDARLFEPQIRRFSSSLSITIPNVGNHDSIQEIAQEILDQAPTTFHLAGLSMGGIIAMEMMRLEPHRATKLALLDTNHLDEPAERSKIRERHMASSPDQMIELLKAEYFPHYLHQENERIENICTQMAESLGWQSFCNQSIALSHRRDQSEALSAIKIPTLILCGEHDRMCPVEKHQQMQQLIQNSKLEIIPEAGHLPTLEQAEKTNYALAQWLEI